MAQYNINDYDKGELLSSEFLTSSESEILAVINEIVLYTKTECYHLQWIKIYHCWGTETKWHLYVSLDKCANLPSFCCVTVFKSSIIINKM